MEQNNPAFLLSECPHGIFDCRSHQQVQHEEYSIEKHEHQSMISSLHDLITIRSDSDLIMIKDDWTTIKA